MNLESNLISSYGEFLSRKTLQNNSDLQISFAKDSGFRWFLQGRILSKIFGEQE